MIKFIHSYYVMQVVGTLEVVGDSESEISADHKDVNKWTEEAVEFVGGSKRELLTDRDTEGE